MTATATTAVSRQLNRRERRRLERQAAFSAAPSVQVAPKKAKAAARRAVEVRYSVNSGWLTLYVSTPSGASDAACVEMKRLEQLSAAKRTLAYDLVGELLSGLAMRQHARKVEMYRAAADALLIARDDAIERGFIAS
jgi:hypothetical protein